MKREMITILCILVLGTLVSCGKVAPAADGKPAKGMTLILGAGEDSLPDAETETGETNTVTEVLPEVFPTITEEVTETVAPSITEEVTVTPSVTESLTDTPALTPSKAATATPTPTAKPDVEATATPTPTKAPDPTATATPTPVPAGSYSGSDCVLSINGVSLKPAGDFTGKQDSLGKVVDTQQGVACLDDGYDINYLYDGFSVFTLSNDGVQKIYSVDATKKGIGTSKGIKIGTSTEEDLVRVYGKPSDSSGIRREYIDGKYRMTFYVESGVVVEILITDGSVG